MERNTNPVKIKIQSSRVNKETEITHLEVNHCQYYRIDKQTFDLYNVSLEKGGDLFLQFETQDQLLEFGLAIVKESLKNSSAHKRNEAARSLLSPSEDS